MPLPTAGRGGAKFQAWLRRPLGGSDVTSGGEEQIKAQGASQVVYVGFHAASRVHRPHQQIPPCHRLPVYTRA